ncbi:hypothetical protein J2S41_003055 [Catenuloplanes atrovinosus]|uniref:Uncharacterized protein n=1 Tax=Catenuloplanes atrovinosus TaxID=137266 RepID=A0AAE3YNG5_9ACTN|nr:hypothetical protein [Catenuloplanes atrovinosus]
MTGRLSRRAVLAEAGALGAATQIATVTAGEVPAGGFGGGDRGGRRG